MQGIGDPGNSGPGVADGGSGGSSSGSPDDALLLQRLVAAAGDRYELEDQIGRGGMAVVYRARDVRLRRLVALKVLPPELAFRTEVRQRFLREAQTAAQLSHPNIVPIFSVDEGEGLVWFSMGLVEGESLAALLARERKPSLDFVKRVVKDVADALEYAHNRGVIHRDVKPDNILLDRETGRAVVTDFGIARAAEAGTRLTATGIAVGTPTYMSPEQALGEREVDARSDIYSLGVVAFQMLAGETPFKAVSTPAMLMKHVSERARSMAELRPELPSELAYAVDRSLEKSPEDRWATAREFREAVDGVLSGPLRPLRAASAKPESRVQEHRAVPAPLPAHGAPQPPPAPALPPYPAFPASTNREARELWRRQQEQWRHDVQHRLAARGRNTRDNSKLGKLRRYEEKPLEERFAFFRRKAIGVFGTIGLLGFINLVTFPIFPWVVFPAWGMLRGLSPYWQSLKVEGVTSGDVWNGRLPEHLRLRRARSGALARDATLPSPHAHWWERLPALEKRVRSLQRWAAATVALPTLGLITGALAAEPGFLAMGLFAGWFGFIVTMVKGVRLRSIGVKLRDVLRPGWRGRLKALDPRTDADKLESEARELVAGEVLAGPQGEVVRQALAQRQAIRRSLETMSEGERDLLPDVLPTTDALVERVGSLAQALHRLERDVPAGIADDLDERLALLDSARDSGDTERRRSLLERQRQTLEDLHERRRHVAGQLESAVLVLQQMKLDLLRLRSAGFQSSLGAVTSATQEARALSRDIGYLLDANAEIGDELRRTMSSGKPPASGDIAPGGGTPDRHD